MLALVVRLVYLSQLEGTPVLAGLMGDGRVYDAWAQQIAGGQWMGTEVFYQAPLYPYCLAIIYRIAGHDVALVRLCQAVLGAASCLLIGLAGRRSFSDRAGVLAALLLAVYPPAFFFDGLIQKSSLDLFLVTVMLALTAGFQARRDWRWLVALGVAAATFTLNRENGRVLLPVIAGWLVFGFPDVTPRRRAAWTTAFAAAAMVVLLPVGLRNYRIGGEFLVSTSQLGPNFYIGNHPHASGSYEPLVRERGDPIYEREDAARLASQAVGRELSPAEVSDYWLRESFAYIRTQPLAWLALVGKKALLTLNARELPDTESIEAYADYSGILRALLWFNFGVLLPLAALGAWLHRGEWRRLVILHGMFVALALAVSVFYVVARYRYPLVPIVLLFAAAGLNALMRCRTGAMRGQWRAGLTIAALVAIVANLPMNVVRDQTYLNLGSLLAQNGKPGEAIPLLRKAVSQEPGYAEPHFRLGLAYRDAGQAGEAIDELTAAVRLRPEHADAHNALAVLLQAHGRAGEALPHFREAARLAPASVEARTNLGLALASAGEYESAVEQFREAVRLRPDVHEKRVNFAQALCAAGLEAECIEQYEAAARLAPDPAVARQITDALQRAKERPARRQGR